MACSIHRLTSREHPRTYSPGSATLSGPLGAASRLSLICGWAPSPKPGGEAPAARGGHRVQMSRQPRAHEIGRLRRPGLDTTSCRCGLQSRAGGRAAARTRGFQHEAVSRRRSGIPAKSRALRVSRTASSAAAVVPIAMSAARRRGEPRRRKTSAARSAKASEKGTIPSSRKNDRATASCSGVRGPRENSPPLPREDSQRRQAAVEGA